MESCYYHSFYDPRALQDMNACNLSSDEFPLMVNCAGMISSDLPFTTDNEKGRADFYLMVLTEGELTVTVGNSESVATAGSVLLFPPNKRYHYRYAGGNKLCYYWVHFTGSYAEQFLSECGFAPLPFCKTAERESSVTAKFRRLFELYEQQTPLQNHLLSCALEQLLLSIALSIEKHPKAVHLEKSLRYIHSSYHTDVRIPELAKMENLSHSRYITLFREQTGLSPTAYLIGLRMRIACELLQTTDLTVAQIAITVGYSDAHFFSKLFKKYVGTSPKQYRQGT